MVPPAFGGRNAECVGRGRGADRLRDRRATSWQSLKAQGYNVMLNGSISEPLSECTVTGVHNPGCRGRAIGFTTVYVDVTCPDD